MTDLEERLRGMVANLREKNEELQSEKIRLMGQRDHAEYRVRNELEPRIESDKRAYDNWATSPERGM